MKFRSKIDWWMFFLLVGWIVGNIWAIVSYAANGGLGALVIVISFTPISVFVMGPMLLRTYYLFDDDNGELVIRSGLGKGTRIAYDRLVSASRTKNPVNSPALSMDRVEIKFNFKSGKASDTVIISPDDREEFFAQLKARNESMEISDEFKPISKGYRTLLVVVAVFSGFVLIGVAVLMVVGMSEPDVTVRDERIKISGMYGLSVSFSQIYSVTLVEGTMTDIYGGEHVIRTNGFGGAGQSNKGHFTSAALGAHMLFVQAETSPTIHIERLGNDIFISFRDSERTRQLYSEIAAARGLR